jgi:hypothetical protein
MRIEVNTPGEGIRTYLYREENIPSSRTGKAIFGQTSDPDGVFGHQKGSILVQFLPSNRPYANAEGYGLDPIIDSARIFFTLSEVKGDTTQVQQFDVWRVDTGDEPLSRDLAYHMGFPIEKYKREKLFEFTHTGRRSVAARLFPTAAGKAYLESIVSMKWEDYMNDTAFLKTYNGLYITPAEGSIRQAALYAASLASSGMQLHVRNHDTLDRSAIYDTLTTSFLFRDTDNTESSVRWDNVSINMMQFDYSDSELAPLEAATDGFKDTVSVNALQRVVYVQGGGGVTTYMRLSDELVDRIRNLKFTIDQEGQEVGKDIAINQAVINIPLEDPSTASMDGSMARLGSYLNLRTLRTIPDYQYYYEQTQQESNASYRLPYNGYLNRSNGYYELDITAFVQRLAKEKAGDPDYRYISPAFFLGPEIDKFFGLGTTVLKGSESDSPITIRITYTIIEG